ncbi:MAG: hypothetical protein JXR07_15420 [Reichenbachiella sp.]
MHFKNSIFFLILFLLIACQKKQDLSIGSRYGQIRVAQDDYFQSVIDKGISRLSVDINNEGRLDTSVRKLNDLQELVSEYLLIAKSIANKIEYRFEGDIEILSLVDVPDSAFITIVKQCNDWLSENDSEVNLTIDKSTKGWLLNELKFRQTGMQLLVKKISEFYNERNNPHLAFKQDSSLVHREVFYVFKQIEINGTLVDLDSAGLFKLSGDQPSQIIIRKDVLTKSLETTEDVVFNVE